MRPLSVHASEETHLVRQVPLITFQQQVDIVVAIKKKPAVLQASVNQDGDKIMASLIIANDQDRPQAKALAESFIRLIKKKSLDEDPGKEVLGTGLYTYHVNVTRANKAVLATGIKRADEKKLQWAIDADGHKNEIIAEEFKSVDEQPQ